MLQEGFPGLEAEALDKSSAPVCICCCSQAVRPPREGLAAAVPAIMAIYLFRPAWRAQGFYQGISWCALPGSGDCISTESQDR